LKNTTDLSQKNGALIEEITKLSSPHKVNAISFGKGKQTFFEIRPSIKGALFKKEKGLSSIAQSLLEVERSRKMMVSLRERGLS
jgi:hypothetical protein